MYAAAAVCRPGREPRGREAKGSTLSTFLFSFKQVPARQGQPTAPGNKKDKEEQLWQ